MDHHEDHEGHEEYTFEVFLPKVTGLMNFNTPKLKEGMKRYVL